MKELYKKPEVDLEEFEATDVLTASSGVEQDWGGEF